MLKLTTLEDLQESVYYNTANRPRTWGQHTTAIVDCNRAIQLKPDYAEAHFTRGFAKYRIGRIWEAKQDLQTALKLVNQTGNEHLKTQIEDLLQRLN